METLPGTIQSPSPIKGFDCDTALTADQAQAFQQAGYSFCIRYISIGQPQNSGDLTNNEAAAILKAGLALMAVQHVRAPGWVPTGALGTTDGTNTVANAQSIGLPSGMNIWCDLEGVQAGTSAQSVIDYCQNWYNMVSEAGYVPGLYVGANAILNGQQLYNLSFQHYWQSMSEVPAIPNRGYQMVQLPTVTGPDGIQIDPDTVQTDNLGGNVLWLTLG